MPLPLTTAGGRIMSPLHISARPELRRVAAVAARNRKSWPLPPK